MQITRAARFRQPRRADSPPVHDRRDLRGLSPVLPSLALEVKAAATVTEADFRGLRKLREAAGRRFAAGVVLYDGEASASFGEGLVAVPLRSLWESPGEAP